MYEHSIVRLFYVECSRIATHRVQLILYMRHIQQIGLFERVRINIVGVYRGVETFYLPFGRHLYLSERRKVCALLFVSDRYFRRIFAKCEFPFSVETYRGLLAVFIDRKTACIAPYRVYFSNFNVCVMWFHNLLLFAYR